MFQFDSVLFAERDLVLQYTADVCVRTSLSEDSELHQVFCQLLNFAATPILGVVTTNFRLCPDFDVKISLNTQIWRGVVFPLFLKIKPYWTEKWILRFKSHKFSIDLGVIEPKLNTFWHQNKLKIDVANKVGSDLGVKYQNSVFHVSWRTVASKVGPCSRSSKSWQNTWCW